MKEVLIVCDGSSLGNGNAETRAAAVALLEYRGLWRAVGKFLGTATNQQAEIAAATLGLQSLKEPCSVKVFTDSRYVVETMAGRFKRKANHDWWQKLDGAAAKHRIEWHWTKGHAGGQTAQEAADRAARRIATLEHADDQILRDAVESISH